MTKVEVVPAVTVEVVPPVTVSVLPARYEHIAPIAIHMRQADRDEVMALGGHTPFEALEMSFEKSAEAWTFLLDGEPAGMFGVGTLNILTRKGSAWLLATDLVDEHWRVFLRGSVFWRDQLLSRYDTLANLIDARNRNSIRWLRWLGAEISDPIAQKGGGVVRLFELRR